MSIGRAGAANRLAASTEDAVQRPSKRTTSMTQEIKPAYLLHGTDHAKVDVALARLRDRAVREGGEGTLESFSAREGAGAPDVDGLIAAIPAMSLIASRRYLVADGVERLAAKQAKQLAEALTSLPPDTTVVLAAREQPPRVRAPKPLLAAVESVGGELHAYEAPRARELPGWVVAEARRRGFSIEPEAARLLVDRMGAGTVRLGNELDRLALWAVDGDEVTVADLEGMVADTSEEMIWSLSDAVVEGRAGAAGRIAERLAAQGESLPAIVYGVASRLRKAHQAAAQLAAGRPPSEVRSRLEMSPYAAKMVLRSVSGVSPGTIRAAACAIADLEWWSRGGSEYGEATAITLAIRRAARARPG